MFCSRVSVQAEQVRSIHAGTSLALVNGQESKVVNPYEVTSASDLRYVEATQVEHPSGTLAGLSLCTQEDEKLGSVNGVLVEPASRRIRYFVVERPKTLRRRHYLLAADMPASIEAGDGKLRVMAHVEDLERFDSRSVRTFSDDDLITAMFAHPAA
jgi:hypothetical protein